MKKLDSGQTISILANLGVISGIVFLAVEINQNTQATVAAASEELTNQSLEYFSLGMDNQVIARALHKDATGQELDSFERDQLQRHQYLNFRVFESAYLQYLRGFYDESEWDRYRRIIRSRLTTDRNARQMWDDSLDTWTEEFSAEVNSILESSDAAVEADEPHR